MSRVPRAPVDTAVLGADVRAGHRRALAKAITLLESSLPDDRAHAEELLEALLPASGCSLRIGVSGAPGVGKSTFIEAFGLFLIEQGHRVAVLAVDPSSARSGGAILGDKTRMEALSLSDSAFIRPSPAGGNLGGVAASTREAMVACEAAGFDIVVVETVGVGQSETAVAGMTDVFLLLQLPNAGDELQAIKKGIAELADVVVVNKADSDSPAVERAVGQWRAALSLRRASIAACEAQVLKVSSRDRTGIAELWQAIQACREHMQRTGEFSAKRRRQARAWMWELIEAGLHARFNAHDRVAAALPGLSAAVEAGQVSAAAAARQLLDHFASST